MSVYIFRFCIINKLHNNRPSWWPLQVHQCVFLKSIAQSLTGTTAKRPARFCCPAYETLFRMAGYNRFGHA